MLRRSGNYVEIGKDTPHLPFISVQSHSLSTLEDTNSQQQEEKYDNKALVMEVNHSFLHDTSPQRSPISANNLSPSTGLPPRQDTNTPGFSTLPGAKTINYSASIINAAWLMFCHLFGCCWSNYGIDDDYGNFSEASTTNEPNVAVATSDQKYSETIRDDCCSCIGGSDIYPTSSSSPSYGPFILPPYNDGTRRYSRNRQEKYSSLTESHLYSEFYDEGCCTIDTTIMPFPTGGSPSHVSSLQEASTTLLNQSLPCEAVKRLRKTRKRKTSKVDSYISVNNSAASPLSNAVSAESGLGLESISFSADPSIQQISLFLHKPSNIMNSSSICIPSSSPSLCSVNPQSLLLYLPEDIEERTNEEVITEEFSNGPPVCISRRQSMESLEICDEEDTHLADDNILELSTGSLLAEVEPDVPDKICCVIDLDETLVHSSFEPLAVFDFTVTIELEGLLLPVYVCKRPHVDDFLRAVADLFECVLFTASVSKYAEPVIDFLDPQGTIFQHRLFRESCRFCQGSYIKNLDDLGRSLKRTVILDNSPVCYYFHPRNAIPIGTWFDDPNDCVLLELIPYFQRLSKAKDVLVFLQENTPPGLQYISTDDREYVTALGSTMFTRSSNCSP